MCGLSEGGGAGRPPAGVSQEGRGEELFVSLCGDTPSLLYEGQSHSLAACGIHSSDLNQKVRDGPVSNYPKLECRFLSPA